MGVFFQTFIDVDEWNAARWKAAAFYLDPLGESPPCLGLVFTDIEAGKRIFSHWLQRLGKVDRYEELRISIVEGEIPGEASGYSVYISSNPNHTEEHAKAEGIRLDASTSVIIGRWLRMIPEPGSPHLTGFECEFAKHGEYLLLPVSVELEPQFECAISKRELVFRRASEITKGDLDSVVFPEHYFGGGETVH